MKKISWKWLAMAGAILFLPLVNGCDNSDDDDGPTPDPGSSVPEAVQRVNYFVEDMMSILYLWNKEAQNIMMTQQLNPTTQADSEVFFRKLKHAKDQWSTLTDDVAELQGTVSGEGTTFGYSLSLYGYSNSDGVFGIVQFVYRGTPAEAAGIKRGDIITRINGGDLTQSNYRDLFYAPTIKIGFGELRKEGEQEVIYDTDRSVSMVAEEMFLNPVILSKVITKGSAKIGYLLYSDYQIKSHDDLQNVFNSFKAAGVTDVVLDLRYNGGGYSLTSQFLSSILVSKAYLDNKSVYTQSIYNDDVMAIYKEQGVDLKDYFETHYVYNYKDGDKVISVDETITSNMNLSRIYILTGSGTASASESTIVGLKPYLDVVRIGAATSGKYCGGRILTAKNIYNNPHKDLDNWGMYVMEFRFANKDGVTDFVDGFAPDYAVEDDELNGIALGDEQEPLLGRAISLITGTPWTKAAVQTRSAQMGLERIPGAITRSNDFNGRMISVRELPALMEE